MSKTIPLSVRVSPDDAEFISALDIAGASTPSDKVRALLADARKRQEGFRDYRGCLAMANEMLASFLHDLRELENRERVHSEVVSKLVEWLPETLAFLLTSLHDVGSTEERERLEEFERGVADRTFRLLESVLRLGVTAECRGYDPRVIATRIEPVLELVEVIRSRR